MLPFTEGQSGDTVTTFSYEQAASLREKNSHERYNNNLEASTFPMYQNFVHKLEYLLLES
jgi:hypothetical protein